VTPPSDGAVTIGSPPPAPPPTAPSHARHVRCAWIGADTAATGNAAFIANPDRLDAIHPQWFSLDATGAPQPASFADDPTVVATAHAHGVVLMPLVFMGQVANLRAALATPQTIVTHVAQLAQLAAAHGYDGLELDYEGLWTAADRAPFLSLVAQAADALHAQGRLLSLALPAMAYDNGQSAYDYAALAAKADVLHLMGYDYHSLGTHLGPLAPKGWIAAVAARVQSLGSPNRFILGVANYAIGNGWYSSAAQAIAACTAPYSSTTTHMLTCPFGSDEAGLAPHCTTAMGDAWFEDAASLTEKAQVAKAHALRGVTYYTLGGEPAGWQAAIDSVYP
jgi:spore germination protein YaaH